MIGYCEFLWARCKHSVIFSGKLQRCHYCWVVLPWWCAANTRLNTQLNIFGVIFFFNWAIVAVDDCYAVIYEALMLLVVCVAVPFDPFENVMHVLIHETAALPCTASPGTKVFWFYQQYCDHFDHGLDACSNRTVITAGNQYQIRTNTHGEHSLLVTDVTKNMMGLYTCENSEIHSVSSSVFLNVICKYNFVLLLAHL